jgi:hypothetical protein
MKPNFKDFILPFLACYLLFIFTAIIVILMFHTVPAANSQMVNIFIGAISGMALTAVSFYFGSSKGSADKTQILADAPPIVPPAPPETPDPNVVTNQIK